MPSIFSRIIARELPAHILYEDDRVIAFLDINPVTIGHTLVVPKSERVNALESAIADVSACWAVIQKITPAIVKTTQSEGCNITTNIGEASGQQVFHTHFHIIPRTTGDGLSLWPHTDVSQEELVFTAEQIRSQL
mgnify:CR=1 FL=1